MVDMLFGKIMVYLFKVWKYKKWNCKECERIKKKLK